LTTVGDDVQLIPSGEIIAILTERKETAQNIPNSGDQHILSQFPVNTVYVVQEPTALVPNVVLLYPERNEGLLNTYSFSPIYNFLAIPTPPDVTKEPVKVDVESTVPLAIIVSKLPVIPPYTLFTTPTPPNVSNAPVVVEVESTVPENTPVAPTYKFSNIPAPPPTINAPVVVEVEAVVALAIRVSNEPDIPPNTLFSMPTPPPITTVPVVVEVESTVPENTPVAPTYKFFPHPIPPPLTREPVVVEVELAVPRAITVSKLPVIPP
jgi:hypothetical protein